MITQQIDYIERREYRVGERVRSEEFDEEGIFIVVKNTPSQTMIINENVREEPGLGKVIQVRVYDCSTQGRNIIPRLITQKSIREGTEEFRHFSSFLKEANSHESR